MKICSIVFVALLCATVQAQAQEDPNKSQDLSQFDVSTPSSDVISVDPDLVELVVELDPRAYGHLARTRTMQINLELDPLIMGRATLGFQLQLFDGLMLDIPLYFEHSKAAMPLGKWAGLFNNNLESYWAVGAGAGVKWRLSEWVFKSSFYLLPRLKAGFYSQKGVGFETTNAISLTPEVIFGWERIFDTGFVVGANIGVEKLIVFSLQSTSLPYVPVISVNPNIQIGYAW